MILDGNTVKLNGPGGSRGHSVVRRRSSGRPMQGAAPEKVEMQVAYRLSPVRSAVDDETVSSVVQPFAFSDTGSKDHELSGQNTVVIL